MAFSDMELIVRHVRSEGGSTQRKAEWLGRELNKARWNSFLISLNFYT